MEQRPFPPSSPEARAILQAFIDSRCQFRYTGHGAGLGERCTEPASWPPDNPRFCCKEHGRHRAGSRYRTGIDQIPIFGKPPNP